LKEHSIATKKKDATFGKENPREPVNRIAQAGKGTRGRKKSVLCILRTPDKPSRQFSGRVHSRTCGSAAIHHQQKLNIFFLCRNKLHLWPKAVFDRIDRLDTVILSPAPAAVFHCHLQMI
jgi:hypothetical protein